MGVSYNIYLNQDSIILLDNLVVSNFSVANCFDNCFHIIIFVQLGFFFSLYNFL